MALASKDAAKFGYSVTVAFTINYIVGTGFLTIPWAFSQAGCFLSTLILSIIAYFSIAAALFVLESMARAETLHHLRGDETALLLQEDSKPNRIGNEKFEVPELCHIFLGLNARTIYTACISLYMFCSLLAYATVFANAFTAHFNVGVYSYHLYLSVFAALVVPLSCTELSEQVTLQVTLAAGRLFMLILMVSTVAWATWTHSNPFGGYQTLTHGEFQEFHPNRIHAALPILVFANIFHHSIPELSNPVDNKLQLGSIYTTTILICFVGYLILGVVLSLFFGKAVPTSANLLWSDYSGPTPSLLQAAASAFIVIFPALDVASCFPLCAITLGNNILSAYYGEQVHTMAESKPHRVAFRLLAAAPPVLTAAFVTDLGAITRVSGICGFAIAFIFPSLLAYYSEKRMRALHRSPDTPYSSIFTTHASIVLTVLLSVVMLVMFACMTFI